VVGAIKNGFDNLQAHHILVEAAVLIQISSLRAAPFPSPPPSLFANKKSDVPFM